MGFLTIRRRASTRTYVSKRTGGTRTVGVRGSTYRRKK